MVNVYLGIYWQHGLVQWVLLIGVLGKAVVSENNGVLKPAAHREGVSNHCPLHT